MSTETVNRGLCRTTPRRTSSSATGAIGLAILDALRRRGRTMHIGTRPVPPERPRPPPPHLLTFVDDKNGRVPMSTTKLEPLRGPPAPETGKQTMKAVVQDRYSPAPEGLFRVAQIDRPTITDDEVLVRVHAASVDRGTWHIMAGLPYPIRLAGFGLRRPKYANPGRSLAGTVEAVGTGVTGFAPGDEVYGTCNGSFAEYAALTLDKLGAKPANLTYEQAAAAPISAVTALQGLRDRGRVQPGHKVLIVGASGGVGTFAVQIAKALGAEVTGVCSTSKVDLVRSLGADHVIDYTTDDVDDGRRYDVILDTGGHRSLRRLRGTLTRTGTLVIVGSETDGRWLGGFGRTIRAMLLSPFISQKLTPLASSENATDLIAVTGLVESGQVTPVVDRTYPLEEAAAAIRHMLDGKARGKVVVSVSPGHSQTPAPGSTP
jgi:NADPH:quinone reductase-like Zn-dependent oxidoreductase